MSFEGSGTPGGLAPLDQPFVAAQALAPSEVAPANSLDPKDGVQVTVQALGQVPVVQAVSMPVAKLNRATKRIMGKPQPGFCTDCWGKAF